MSKTALLTYSALGHAYFHMFTAFYFVIVLSLEVEWQQPYHQLVDLWIPGALLVGAFSVLAGWLGDRWSARGMLVVYFLGMGLSSVLAGYTASPIPLLLALCGIGAFAAIYHPIGIPLVIRYSDAKQGMALAINGVFGSVGGAMAGGVTGYLASLGGSRLAFVLPGVVVTLTGVLMLFGMRDQLGGRKNSAPAVATRVAESVRLHAPLLILLFCLTTAGFIYHATQTVLPKAFSLRLDIDIATAGAYVAVVYLIAGVFQFVGGALADRYSLKWIYFFHLGLHGVMLLVAAYTNSFALVVLMCAAAALGSGALPAENLLLARHTPKSRHGLMFGVKFVLFFGTGPIGVLLVSEVHRITGQFIWVFLGLAGIAAITAFGASLLPRRSPNPSPA